MRKNAEKTEGHRPVWKRLFQQPLPLQNETVRFVLANALDVFTTYLLLWLTANRMLNASVIESNAVARFFLNHWGIKGLVYFKFAMTALVLLLAQLIALKKLESARWLLNVGTLVVAAVVVYSLVMLVRHASWL